MGLFKGLGFSFEETMYGYVQPGESDCEKGYAEGKRLGNHIRFEVKAEFDDLDELLDDPNHRGKLTGTLFFAPLGGRLDIDHGWIQLFNPDPETLGRQMVYAFTFTASDGTKYFLHGHKEIRDDPGFDVVEDMTHLFTKIYKGSSVHGDLWAAGIIEFHLKDGPALVSSMEVTGTNQAWRKALAKIAFVDMAWGALRDVYFSHKSLVYHTWYRNLVLEGALRDSRGRREPFFLVSGIHDKGFPWGDGEWFWDVLLVVGDVEGDRSELQRYAISRRVLKSLELYLERDGKGTYRYKGPAYVVPEDGKLSFLKMAGSGDLEEVELDIALDLTVKAYNKVELPFPITRSILYLACKELREKIEEVLPSHSEPGMNMTPYMVTAARGNLKVAAYTSGVEKTETIVNADVVSAHGEAEDSRMMNIKEPTLLYGYICKVDPNECRVQVHTDALRDERYDWSKDMIDKAAGAMAAEFASVELTLTDSGIKVARLDGNEVRRRLRNSPGRAEALTKGPDLLVPVGEPLIEVRNDQYPTAAFIRRIIMARYASGKAGPALQEAMDTIKLEPVGSDEEVTVACFRGQDKLGLLDRSLDETGFDGLVKEMLAQSGKPASEFMAVIKANFMFSYHKEDHTSYTDPELVASLAHRLRSLGAGRVALVEAHSTYGEYFQNRDVKSVADYLGYDGAGGAYEVVDLTLEARDAEKVQVGPCLGMHPVPPTWRDADFRISFAKNKTHAYTYYTLTLKNVYGALPLANKFKEYHYERDIYDVTMEYLAKYPVHFGIIDAIVGADGPFGVFADMRPNHTDTVIAGKSLVAVDWVGASKMGLNPMVSRFMGLAVDKFGKPGIDLRGDSDLYLPWLNVPAPLVFFTNNVLDKYYKFGNLFYASAAHMDETAFPLKPMPLSVRVLRMLTIPLRKAFFIWTGQEPTWYNRLINWVLYKMGY